MRNQYNGANRQHEGSRHGEKNRHSRRVNAQREEKRGRQVDLVLSRYRNTDVAV